MGAKWLSMHGRTLMLQRPQQLQAALWRLLLLL